MEEDEVVAKNLSCGEESGFLISLGGVVQSRSVVQIRKYRRTQTQLRYNALLRIHSPKEQT